MTYQTISKVFKRGSTKKLAHRTYAVKDGDLILLKYWNTAVLTFHPDGRVVVNSGGFRTKTTKRRINDHLEGRSIYQKKFDWFWDNGIPFEDGDIIKDGELIVT